MPTCVPDLCSALVFRKKWGKLCANKSSDSSHTAEGSGLSSTYLSSASAPTPRNNNNRLTRNLVPLPPRNEGDPDTAIAHYHQGFVQAQTCQKLP